MFPKLETQTCLKKEKIAGNIIHEDHIRRMLARTQNVDYKPWKNNFCPKNAHSPFGDYPRKYMNPMEVKSVVGPMHQNAQASTQITAEITK